MQIDTVRDTLYVDSLITSKQVFLDAIANDPNHISMSAAQTLLENAGLAEFEEPYDFPMGTRSMTISSPAETSNNSFDINDCIEVYPNPASDQLWLEYIIFNDKTATDLFIYDIDGRLVHTQKVKNTYGVEQIDV